MSTKTAVHTVYKTKDGAKVPSVTTVLGVLSKNALIHWAWQCGINGQDYRLVRDDAADIGTLAHYLIMQHLKGETPDTSAYSQEHISQAENCLIKFWDWEKEHAIEPILVEQPLVSEDYKFGGTCDLLCRANGRVWLVDFKTSKAIYSESVYQVAAYSKLIEENWLDSLSASKYILGLDPGLKPDTVRILRIGRNESEGFEERVFSVYELVTGWEIFKKCLEIYELRKGIK